MATGEVVIEDTKNQRGFFHQLTETSQKFITHCRDQDAVALDVGVGNGVATLPTLAEGRRVIAIDIEPAHIEELEKKVPPECKERLRTIIGAFPDALSQVDEPIGAALLSFVVGFLSGEEITEGLSQLFDRMVPGGRIFIIHYTPYTALTKNFLPEYNRRKEAEHPWPGYCENIAQWCDQPELQHNLPNTLNLMDCEVLTREVRQAGFRLVSARYYGGDAVAETYRLDGREWVEVIAEK